MNSESPSPGDNRLGLDQCIEHIRFARAAELARNGKYSEAVALLCPAGHAPKSPRELDLLARMATQQERYDEAARYWQSALNQDPGNKSYIDCLQQLSQVQLGADTDNGMARFAVWAVGGAFILVVILVLFVWKPQKSQSQIAQATTQTNRVAGVPDDKPRTSVPPQVGLPSGVESQSMDPNEETDSDAMHGLRKSIDLIQKTQLDQVQTLGGQIASIQTNQVALLEGQNTLQAQVADLAKEVIKSQAAVADLSETKQVPLTSTVPTTKVMEVPIPFEPQIIFNPQLPGVTVRTQSNGCLVLFDKGLFRWDDNLVLGAKPLLKSVARTIVQTQEKIKIEVVGFAENEPPTWPWQKPKTDEALGQIRAERVKSFIESLGIFPASVFSATNGPSSDRPYPGQSPRNRTVVLRISQQ
jgi:outer membrane protein OmpA-like peptidoglycan-associated protein